MLDDDNNNNDNNNNNSINTCGTVQMNYVNVAFFRILLKTLLNTNTNKV